MELTIRAAAPAEQLYAGKQSTQIVGQTGAVGCMQGIVGRDGIAAATWENCRNDWKTDELNAELDGLLDALCSDMQSGEHQEHTFRADTKDYTYLIRSAPAENHVSIYPYRREWLERHMKRAEKGIRFITPDYKEKFRIPDGDMVRIRRFDGSTVDRVCRYIDDCHLEVGNELFHICQFAVIMEHNGNSVIPLRSALPEECYGILPSSNEIIQIKKGERGYSHVNLQGSNKEEAQRIVDEYNEKNGVTKAQAAAMLAGSMFGWDVPAADPKNYNEQGRPVRPRHRDRGDAR